MNTKGPSRGSDTPPLTNGKMANGGHHLINGDQPESTLNGHDGSQDAAHINGHSHPGEEHGHFASRVDGV